AAREAEVHTSVTETDENYERALVSFVRRLLGKEGEAFRTDVDRFVGKVAATGALNSLAQVVLKIASPGVPDFYQGTERWFLRLEEPDNREAADFGAAMRSLVALPVPFGGRWMLKEIASSWPDGRLKLSVTTRALSTRRDHA